MRKFYYFRKIWVIEPGFSSFLSRKLQKSLRNSVILGIVSGCNSVYNKRKEWKRFHIGDVHRAQTLARGKERL